MKRASRKSELIFAALAIVTIMVYWQVTGFDFVDFDDDIYVEENQIVQRGLTREGFVWAFTTGRTGNWHPLTWLSLMLDCQLSQNLARCCHTTNVLIHIANTLLLFWVLKRMTSAFWCSAFVAALFALHPLHVESVAWISERKDVLSTLFFFLTILFYIRYVERRGFFRYVPVVLCFALGLLAKAMLVTLPFALLLLDYWPLGRFRPGKLAAGGEEGKNTRKAAGLLVFEKAPLFVLTVILCLVTYLLHKSTKGIMDLDLDVQLANVVASYGRYIGRMFWPRGLAVIYLHPNRIEVGVMVISLIVLICISAVVIFLGRRRPYLVVGWLWYIGLLIPVIGFVQIGNHSMADRYSYVPLIGLFIMLTWSAAELAKAKHYPKGALATAGILIVLLLSVCTVFQIRHWQNGVTLFARAIDVTGGNYVAYNNFGMALDRAGKVDEAIEQWKQALRLNPNHYKVIGNLVRVLVEKGHIEEALFYYSKSVGWSPDDCRTRTSLADTLFRLRGYHRAVEHYEAALAAGCDDASIHYNLAVALSHQGRYDDSILHYSKFLQQQPDSFRAHNNLGAVLMSKRDDAEAIRHFQEALRLNWDYFGAHMNLATILMERGNIPEAIKHYEQAVRIDPNDITARRELENAREAAGKQAEGRRVTGRDTI